MMENNKTWIVTIQDDGQENLFITLPPELLALKEWRSGDAVEWIDLGNGAWELRKK